MRISVPREIKPEEARVGLTPTMVTSLTAQGHEVFVEEGAGLGAGFSDDDYREAGAQLTSQEEAWAQAELLVKVKEPLPRRVPATRRPSARPPRCGWPACPS